MDENLARGARDPQQVDAFSDPADRETPVPPDTLLSAVSNEHRRAILTALDDQPEKTLEFDALVEEVADRVQDGNAEPASDDQRQRVRIALHHTHLPKLEEAGMIDYEAETGRVQVVVGKRNQEILPLIELLDAGT